jgi:hypothetical protein
MAFPYEIKIKTGILALSPRPLPQVGERVRVRVNSQTLKQELFLYS